MLSKCHCCCVAPWITNSHQSCMLQAQWPFLPFEEKNLLKPRVCFSGVGVEEADDEVDLVGLWFGFCTEDMAGKIVSLSDGLYKLLLKCKGESPPNLCTNVEVALSISAWSCKLGLLGSRSVKFSAFEYGDSIGSVWGCRAFNCLPRRNMVSWHSASFSAAAVKSLSYYKGKNSILDCLLITKNPRLRCLFWCYILWV